MKKAWIIIGKFFLGLPLMPIALVIGPLFLAFCLGEEIVKDCCKEKEKEKKEVKRPNKRKHPGGGSFLA